MILDHTIIMLLLGGWVVLLLLHAALGLCRGLQLGVAWQLLSKLIELLACLSLDVKHCF
jgi:hypothetical protein